MASFNFTGEITIAPETSERPGFREGTTKNGETYLSMNMSVAAAKNNRAFCESFGMIQDKIIAFDKDGEKVEIDWGDREDSEVINRLSNMSKRVISIGGERHEFITDYDFIRYIQMNQAAFKEKKFTVTGQMNKNFYKGNVSDRFRIQNIYEVEDEDKKNQLIVKSDVFFTKDSIDTNDWASEHKLIINGYTYQYIDKDNGKKYVDQQIIFDCSKVDFDNERHVSLVKFKLKQIGLTLDSNNKIKNTLKSGVYKISMKLLFQFGAEEVDFDESQLTDNQKEAIALGFKTINDFRPAGEIYGDRVRIYKLVDYDLREPYEDGCVKDKMSMEDFEEQIYSAPKEVKLSEVIKEELEKEEDEDIEDDDLFS